MRAEYVVRNLAYPETQAQTLVSHIRINSRNLVGVTVPLQ